MYIKLNDMEFYSVSKKDLEEGNFPLNHDCILKVNYIACSPLRFQYFTCRAQDSGRLTLILSNIALIKSITVSSVDLFNDNF